MSNLVASDATAPVAVAVVNAAGASVVAEKIIVGGVADNAKEPAGVAQTAPAETGVLGDISQLRLEQDYVSMLGLGRAITTVPVKKPSKTSFIRVHPGGAFRLQTACLELKDDGEVYLVARNLWPQLAGEPAFTPKVLLTYMSKPGDVVALWPIRLPGPDGRLDEYNRAALEIGTTIATKSWTRVVANRHLGAYEATVAPASETWGEPKWPAITFDEIIRVAFKDRVIDSWEHPVLRRLRGEV